MIYNRIPIAFGGLSRITGPTISYQYDTRQILVFTDLDLPQYYEADICNEGDSTTVTMVGTEDGVLIPNAFLRNGRKVKVYIVVQGTDQGAVETRKELTLPVQIRPAREDIDPTEPEQQQIDELVDLLNDAVVTAMPAGGFAGQFLAKASDNDYATEWVDGGGGGGGTDNYNQLSNKPQINDVTLTGNKSLADLGIAAASDIPTVPVQSVNSKTGNVVLSASDVGAYELPSGGIPSTDLASAVQTSLGKADTALQSAPVASVNSKTGAVTLDASDVGAATVDLGITGASIGSFAKVKTVDGNGKPTSWEYGSGGSGGTSDYSDLTNKPSINSVTLSGNKTASDLGLGTYSKPSGGIPKTDLESAVQTSLGKAYTAYQKPSSGIPAADIASGVIPTVPSAYTSTPAMDGTGSAGSSTSWAKGDHVHPTDTSREPATTYTTLSGTAITQTGTDHTMYLCGELASLTFTAPQTGICAVRFTSGSTATVVTLNGVTMPDDWEGAEADTVYEINILNGYGLVAKWAVST